jgi:hypothetical protein
VWDGWLDRCVVGWMDGGMVGGWVEGEVAVRMDG